MRKIKKEEGGWVRVKRTSREPDGILDQASLDLCMQGRHALVVERDFSADKDVEDDAKAPYVDFWAGVDAGVEELGGGKVEGAAKGGEVGEGVVEV